MTVPAEASGADLIGDMLFPGPARWDVEVWDGKALVGRVLFVLPVGGLPRSPILSVRSQLLISLP